MPKFNLDEGETIDFKEVWSDSALDDLAAFANHKGGTVYVGVRDRDKEVVGFKGGDKEQQSIANKIVSILRIIPSVDQREYKGITILVIRVSPSPRLVSYRDRCPIPVGKDTRNLTPEEIAKRTMDKLGQTWDSLLSGLSMADIDPQSIQTFLRLRERFSATPRLDDLQERVLENLNLLQGGKLTNAGVLLFAQKPQGLFPYARIRMGRFKGEVIKDTRDITGNLWNQFEGAMERFRNYLQVELKIDSKATKGGQREEIWEYPLDALLEGILNALMHRDYTVPGDIQVKVYDDHMVIWNPGGLPEGLTVEALKKEHSSLPRNRLIADAFDKARMIEAWGKGTLKMIRLCREQGLPDPEFSEESGGFKLTFSKDLVKRLEKMGLNGRQIKAVVYVKDKGSITLGEFAKLISGVTDKTLRRDLADLVDKGMLQAVGEKRWRRYELAP